MRKSALVTLILACSMSPLVAQLTVGFHQSNVPFIGINYEINDHLKPELRLGMDQFLDDLAFEGITTYDIVNEDDFEFYGGVGVRIHGFSGFVIPFGLNVYPFDVKKFGFHIEIAPIIGENDILRGSWGIRYRFGDE